ncbi:nucleotide-binding alpha-beta plait domain-containing protein [Tanacetum coccineum]
MESQCSKEDEVQKISTSVFVTNFPNQFTAKELWNTCKQYGYVVDAFIPNRRSKAGPQSMNMGMESNPVLVFDESCVNQQVYAYCLLGKVKEFASLTNLKVVLVSKGFNNVKLKYMGGFWVMLKFSSEESENTFKRIASKWGVLLHVDDQEERCFHGKRVCINTTGYFNILESFKIIYQGKAYWVRAKEIPGWVPDFIDENDEVDESDDESFEGEPNGDNLNNGDDVRGENEIDEVPDNIFEEKLFNTNDDESSDADSLKYPPGFTPRDDIEGGEVQSIKRNVPVDERDEGTHNIHEEVEASRAKKFDSKKNSKWDGMESVCSGHFKNSETPHSGGSILLLMDELVKVGQTMGYNMEGCMKNIEEIIESQGVNGVHR